MSLLRIEQERNGELWTPVNYYSCDRCGGEIYEGFPHMWEGYNTHYCMDCSFILGFVDEDKYLKLIGVGTINANATIRDGKIIVWNGIRPPWERHDTDARSSYQYTRWRTSVLDRDQHTCQHCHREGGELNAHHIMSYAKYKNLRIDTTNGITLCVECHRELHRLERNEKQINE